MRKGNNKNIGLTIVIGIMIIFTIIIYAILINKSEGQFNIKCSSGEIDLYLDMENIEYPQNNTLRIKDFNIYKIKNIDCDIETSSKISLPMLINILGEG